MPKPSLPTCGATSLLCRTPGYTLPGTIIGRRSRPPEKVPNSKIYHFSPPRPLKSVDAATVKASKATPLRNGCCVVTTGTAKTSLAALRAQSYHPLDQPALAEGVFIFDLFELCLVLASRSAANFAIPSICCLQNSAPRIFLFQKSECDKIGAHPRWIFKLFLPRSTGPSWVPSDNTEGALERYRPRHCTLFLETGPIIRTKSGYGTIFLAHWPF